MKQIKKKYISPVSKALVVKMNSTLLTGSDFSTAFWLYGNRVGYADGGDDTWN